MKEYMHYKGYLGSIKTSIEDDLVYGRLEHIKALISYESKTPAGLKKAFEEAVEDYLTICKERGIIPEVPYKGSLNVRIGEERHRLAQERVSAGYFGSLNEYICEALDNFSPTNQPIKKPAHHEKQNLKKQILGQRKSL